MTDKTFMQLCKDMVRKQVDEHLDKSDGIPYYEVYIVWYCKTLQNWKALASTTLTDGMYYEVTYNGDKKELYLDAYKKWENELYIVGGDYKARIKIEYKQLKERIHKLEQVLNSDTIRVLEDKAKLKLLDEQLTYMQAYATTLQERAKLEGIDLV